MKKRLTEKDIFLKKGMLRRQVLEVLNEEMTATEIAKKLDKHRSSVSRALLDLQKAGLVECINSKDSSFRHYVKK